MAPVLLLAGFTLLSQRPGVVEKRLAAIRAQGLPTNLEELDRWLGSNTVAGRSNAALVQIIGENLRVDEKRSLPGRAGAATEAEIAWARAQLTEENEPLFAELHRQLQETQWRWADFSGGAMNRSIGYLSSVKGLATKLQVEAVAAALLRDTNRAAASLLASLRVGRTLEPEPVLIDYLVRVACDAIAAQNAEWVFSRMQLAEPDLVALQTAFRVAEGTNALSRALIGERAHGATIFQMRPEVADQLAAAAGAGGSPGGFDQTFRRILYPLYRAFILNTDFTYYLDQTERLIALARLEVPEARAALDEFGASLKTRRPGDWRRILSRMSLTALSKSSSKEWRRIATMRCARVGCAVERFRAVHGTPPA
ncbi:MAG: hypothetical protein KIT22_19175, partial [Verrucomicrobiae bacterium]|nr:hypothetical protein [Verrucomicrobiae bacterium]